MKAVFIVGPVGIGKSKVAKELGSSIGYSVMLGSSVVAPCVDMLGFEDESVIAGIRDALCEGIKARGDDGVIVTLLSAGDAEGIKGSLGCSDADSYLVQLSRDGTGEVVAGSFPQEHCSHIVYRRMIPHEAAFLIKQNFNL